MSYLENSESIFLRTIEALGIALELRDPYTSGHQYRVATLARKIAEQLGLPEFQCHGIYLGGLLHDIGKIRVPAEVLTSIRKLTIQERELIKTHPMNGHEIIKNIPFPWPINDIVLHHHERLDGSGYPHGLKDNEISLEVRIITVADVFEAMTAHRPYHTKQNMEAVFNELLSNSGTLYDAGVVEACIKLIRDQKYILPVPHFQMPHLDEVTTWFS